MRNVKACLFLLAATLLAVGARAQTPGNNSPDEPLRISSANAATGAAKLAATTTAKLAATTPAKPAAPVAATREEVEELRQEVAELKAALQELLKAKAQPAPAAAKDDSTGNAPLVTAVVTQPASSLENPEQPAELEPVGAWQGGSRDQKPSSPVAAGWNGEHFFIKSADGQFQLQPYGYVQTDHRAFGGDGAPPNTFTVRRGRFGFQGNYGSHFDFGVLIDSAAGSGAIVRDIYINVKFRPEFQFQAGQFKEPFAQELATGITNIDFVERGLQALLYPSAASAYRGPGAVIHGDVDSGVVQYWAGAFNGKGFNVLATTSIPEADGRLRFYPWRKKKDSFFQAFGFGGGISFSRTRGLSVETTPSMTLPDTAYTFFPQFRINGNVWRYNGEFTFLKGPLGVRGEYIQAFFDRSAVGTEQLGGLGVQDLPVVRYKAWNIAATYLLTGEKRPENGTPRVKRPLFGPETPGVSGKGWGAWEVAFRYSGIHGNEPGIFFNNVFTPQNVPTFNRHTDEFTGGLNWYINYWVKYQINFSVDRLLSPSTIGAVRQNYLVALQRVQFRF